LGKVAVAESQYDLAVEYFQGNLAIGEKFGYEDEVSQAYEGLSEVYFQKKDWIRAKQYAELALEYKPPYVSYRTFGFTQMPSNSHQKAEIFMCK